MIDGTIGTPSVLLIQGREEVDQLVRVLVGPDGKVHVDDLDPVLGQVAVASLLQQSLSLFPGQERSCAHPRESSVHLVFYIRSNRKIIWIESITIILYTNP